MASWKKLLHESSPTSDFPTLNQNTSGTAAGLSTALAVASGGTNTTSYTAGDILYASGATTISKLGVGTAGQVLQMNSGATAPEWAAAASGDVTDVTGGAGLTDSGSSGAITVNVGQGTGITVNTNDIAVTAAQTGITGITNSSLKIGRDDDNLISFATDDEIGIKVAGSVGIKLKASGELEAASLDISGNADIDGQLETDALTIGGVTVAAVGTTNITTLGTIATGTWNGSSIAVGYTAAKCTDANADQTSANTCDTPHVATNISWTAGTSAGPTCNSSTGSDAAIPSASGSASGILTTGTQTIAGAKTFSSNLETSGNMIVGGNLQVTGTSTVTNTTTENVSIADSMIKLRAGTASWRDQGFVFDRGAQNAGSEGFVSTNGLDAALWYDASTGHLTVAEVAVDLNEDDTSADDITAITGTANVMQVALCMSSSATPSGVKMPIGSIAVDSDLNSGTPYIRVS